MKTTNPKDYIELLEAFNIALTNGLMERSEVVKWADRIMMKDEEPDFFIIELSLCEHKSINDMVYLIKEYIWPENPQVSCRVILGFVYKRYLAGMLTLRKVIDTIYWLHWEKDLTEQEKGFMYCLEEDYDCAQAGIYGTVEVVEKEALRFLEIYKDFQIENFSEWRDINSTIDGKLKLLSVNVRQEKSIQFKDKGKKKKWWKFW